MDLDPSNRANGKLENKDKAAAQEIDKSLFIDSIGKTKHRCLAGREQHQATHKEYFTRYVVEKENE